MDCPSCHSPNVDNARFCAKCGSLLPVATASEADPLIGQVIKNTFRIVRMIGEGGMGRVYEGEQQMGTTTRRVAIKTLHPDLSRDPQIVARFNRECGTVAELEHPNTIQFFDFGQTPDGTLFIAMEFLEGDSIAKVLEKTGAMPPARVDKIMRQVCGSLTEAHKKGIVHRDLKPENVVLTTRAGEEDFAKVLDFGIAARREATDAKKEQKLTQQGMVLGTPPYMSPEQFKGQELDARSDIYSLGVMSYEMLTGKLPFDAATPWEWATKHLTERPFPFELAANATSIPGPTKTAIMRALSKTREERQATASEFASELSGGGGGVPKTQALSVPGTGTAQMAAPPVELLQAGPPPPPRPATANAMVVPVGQPQYAVVPPATRPAAGSNKAVLVALAAVIGLGAIVGVVMLVGKLRHSESDEGPMAITSTLANTVTVDTATAPPTAPETAEVASSKPSPVKTTVTTASTGAATSTPKGPQGEDACREATKNANGGAIEAAVALYRTCTATGGQTGPTAKLAIERNAGPATKRAVLNGRCAQARSIHNSAESIGAAGTSESELAKCK